MNAQQLNSQQNEFYMGMYDAANGFAKRPNLSGNPIYVAGHNEIYEHYPLPLEVRSEQNVR
jgi:hypothetical protein